VRHALRLHPDSHCTAAQKIEVDVSRPGAGRLALRYLVIGGTSDLVLPPPAASTRADGLWRRTCFEAFVRESPGDDYYEFNFSPSTQWAAYRFAGYRTGMTAASGVEAPRIDACWSKEGYEVQVSLALDPARRGAWRLALASVIEEAGGARSYWALAHPPGRADFHHAEGFALEFSEPEPR